MSESVGYAAVFELGVRCHNCRKDHVCSLAVPDEEGAPTSVEELMESVMLADLRFRCIRCESSIGSIVTATVRSRDVDAEASAA